MTIIILFSSFRFWFRTSFDTRDSWQVFQKGFNSEIQRDPKSIHSPPFFPMTRRRLFHLKFAFFWSKDTTIIWRTKKSTWESLSKSTMWTSASNFVGGGTWIPQLRELKKLVAACCRHGWAAYSLQVFWGPQFMLKIPMGIFSTSHHTGLGQLVINKYVKLWWVYTPWN